MGSDHDSPPLMTTSTRNASAAIRRLTIEYKQLTTDPNTLFPAVGPISEDNYLEWEALLPGPDDTPFEGGVFSARLSFPPTYPLEPPTMRFDPPIFHPNGVCAYVLTSVYPDGLVCISILHAAGDDPNSASRLLLWLTWQCTSPLRSVGRPCSRLKKFCCRCSACLPSRTSRAVQTLMHAYVTPRLTQKLYRDDRAAYEQTIRKQVQEQLGL